MQSRLGYLCLQNTIYSVLFISFDQYMVLYDELPTTATLQL